ncbi:hypothetical protein IQ265_19480 [Nodosilinea sp. LEGE 06152]|uniref:hypothetical protein n=1 Tax=Nodosilinea sp. LEGE 06152 TaxID=2777966 RepID=UPI001880F16C|nr:hypothetical protein [Nodosilinea sp. LEGE 06152]MBE9159000.1 hypothetical protein [Nodosilinea sp. LEGE 06152]
MSVTAFLIAGLVAFGLSFWLTLRLQRSRQLTKSKRGARGGGSRTRPWGQTPPRSRPALPSLTLSQFKGVDLDRQVRDLLNQGKLIDAVKRVRETNGCSLRDAKAYVNERLP